MKELVFDPPISEAAFKAVSDYYAEAHEKWSKGIAGFLTFPVEAEKYPPDFKSYREFVGFYHRPERKFICVGYPHSAPCHAALVFPEEDCVTVAAMKQSVSKICPELVLWIARESPYSYGVVNKDDEEGLLTRGVVIDRRKVGKKGALWICKALRMLTEESFRAPRWKLLMDNGAKDGLVAFIGAQILNREGGPGDHTHGCLCSYPEKNQLQKAYDFFLKAEKSESSEASFYGRGSYAENWGSLKTKSIKVPDGWGGFAIKKEPGDVKDFVEALNSSIKIKGE